MKISFKSLFLLSLYTILFTQYSFAQTKVKVHVTFTNSYCGGARPTPEMEEAIRKEKDFHDVHIILKGKMHCKVKTDSLGRFGATLKSGKYQIHLTKFKNEAHFTNYNPGCVKMLKASYGDLLIEKGKTEYKINLHFPCNPCEPPKQ